jgi:hypothetical protein
VATLTPSLHEGGLVGVNDAGSWAFPQRARGKVENGMRKTNKKGSLRMFVFVLDFEKRYLFQAGQARRLMGGSCKRDLARQCRSTKVDSP